MVFTTNKPKSKPWFFYKRQSQSQITSDGFIIWQYIAIMRLSVFYAKVWLHIVYKSN